MVDDGGPPYGGSIGFSPYAPCPPLPAAGWTALGAVRRCRLLRITSQAIRPAMIAAPPRPPTTPPTIAPTLLLLCADDAVLPVPAPVGVLDGNDPCVLDDPAPEENVTTGTEVLEAVGAATAVDSGRCSFATACAPVTLKASPLTTSIKAHAGMEVPIGILTGQLRTPSSSVTID